MKICHFGIKRTLLCIILPFTQNLGKVLYKANRQTNFTKRSNVLSNLLTNFTMLHLTPQEQFNDLDQVNQVPFGNVFLRVTAICIFVQHFLQLFYILDFNISQSIQLELHAVCFWAELSFVTHRVVTHREYQSIYGPQCHTKCKFTFLLQLSFSVYFYFFVAFMLCCTFLVLCLVVFAV